jgi:serine/threonine protein kinase
MGEVDVCVKALRIFCDPFERDNFWKVYFFFVSCSTHLFTLQDLAREVLIWKELDHPNIIQFLGVDTTLRHPLYCLISPWMKNGNVKTYLKHNPDADRLALVHTFSSWTLML